MLEAYFPLPLHAFLKGGIGLQKKWASGKGYKKFFTMGRGSKKTRVIKRGEWNIFEREKIALFKKNQSYSYK